MKSVWSSSVALAVLALALPGQAQVRTPAQPTSQTPEVMPPSGADGPPADTAEKTPPGSVMPAAGYAYGDHAPSSRAHTTHHARYRHSGPVVTMPGFEQTSDGGSRLFVQLSQPVPIEERKAQGSVTYVLKGASPRVWNNTNALVTVHFNTPVSRARLVPQGADLLFVIELRAAAAPTWKMTEAQDKTAMLQVDFPKGDYLNTPSGEATATPTEDGARPAPPTKGRGRRGPARQAPAKKP